MPRAARLVIPGLPHHITQRGNDRRTVFYSSKDRPVYLDLLTEHCRQTNVGILAYCLMHNHIHLSLAVCFRRTHGR